jgi:hypothetical protein
MLLPLTLEMSVYGLVSGLMARHFRLNIWLSLAVALLSGRIVVAGAVLFLGIENPFSYFASTTSAGLPGIAIQLALLPFLVKLLEKRAA